MGRVGSLLGQRQHPLQAASVVGTSALPPWPRSVSCAAYLLRRHSTVPNVPSPSRAAVRADLEAHAVPRDPRAPVRARAVGPRRRRPISRMRKTRWV
ncbi:UNVERIFIED_CONTAM: hypothetical protein Sradi_2632800 [Sesamum radiatum]|uniref:Uncharacterized protein n=1 Tax=Sesamum radiatum TaxID=300843 RepID=A0AAW2S5Z2_SESRA